MSMQIKKQLEALLRGVVTAGLLFFVGTGHAVEQVTYYHNDALGSPVAATDNNGTLLWREAYEPYGERLDKEAPGTDTVWYTGKQEESLFGISYFGARWYDPEIGRFMATDLVGFNEDNIHSFNKYVYANNNPYAYVDLDGNIAILGAVVAAVSDVVTQSILISVGVQQDFSLGNVAIAAGLGAATGGLANIKKVVDAARLLKNAKKGITNPIPNRLARVIPGDKAITTLGRGGADDVFVTAADDIAGLGAKDLSKRLTISPGRKFTVIEFPTPKSGIASPVNRSNPGFVGRGRTAGGAREFVIPNQRIPSNATRRIVE